MSSAFSRMLRAGPVRWLAGLLGMVLLVSSSAASAQTVRATASVDSVRIGERFTVSVVAAHRFMSSVAFPPDTAGPAVFGDLEVLARTPVAERYLGADAPGMRVDSVAYEVATFALDTARIPPLPVRIVVGGDTSEIRTAPLLIPVRSTVSAEAQGLREMAPLSAFPGPWWPWVLLAVVLLVLVAGMVYYGRAWMPSSREAPSPQPPRPALPPHEAARQRLDALEHTTDWSNPDALEGFFVELSTVVRRYMADRLDVAALERTTPELIRTLHHEATVPDAAIDDVHEVLDRSDLVKFADNRPTSEEGRAALRTTRRALDAIERAQPALRGETAPASPDETTA
ncbi:MAG: hypothetical protein GVY35_15680 [Bacteroidetes bacterium]|jgi:hypothetical protein|nr:hypothetical protein [Bacteroidota bacterium]